MKKVQRTGKQVLGIDDLDEKVSQSIILGSIGGPVKPPMEVDVGGLRRRFDRLVSQLQEDTEAKANAQAAAGAILRIQEKLVEGGEPAKRLGTALGVAQETVADQPDHLRVLLRRALRRLPNLDDQLELHLDLYVHKLAHVLIKKGIIKEKEELLKDRPDD